MSELTELIKKRYEIDCQIKKLKYINHGKVWITNEQGAWDIQTHSKPIIWKLKIDSIDINSNPRQKVIIGAYDINTIKNYIDRLQDDLREVLTCLEELEDLA